MPKPITSASIAMLASATLLAGTAAQTNDHARQTPTVVAHSTDVSAREATLRITLADGESVTVSFSRGEIVLNGRSIAAYMPGETLEHEWRELLEGADQVGPNEILHAVRDWSRENLSDRVAEAVSEELESARSGPAPPRRPRAQRIDISGLDALDGLDALEELEGLEDLAVLGALEALKALDVNALRNEINAQLNAARASAAESALAEAHDRGASESAGSSITSQIANDFAGLLAAFVAMCSLGFGLVFFASRQLEVVADTVRHAFWRSFLVGLLAQPLVVPVFALLMLGLAITVVGLLIVPFAALAFAAAALLGVLGGYLAVARSIGEAYLRRRMSLGYPVGGWLSYRYLVYGLVALSTIWLPPVFLGWAQVAGEIFTMSAILLTWIIATAGFGATILSRAGIRGTFAGHFDQALSDEYLYHTPQATPIAREQHSRDRT